MASIGIGGIIDYLTTISLAWCLVDVLRRGEGKKLGVDDWQCF